MDKIKFKLKENKKFRIGLTSFGCKKGKIINIIRTDPDYKKVLIDFGNDLIDWFDESILEKYFEAL